MFLLKERYADLKGGMHGFELRLGHFSAAFFTKDKELAKKWIAYLKDYCISESFLTDFKIIQVISENTKERVCTTFFYLIFLLEIESRGHRGTEIFREECDHIK